tara:strand:- start:6777 stop:8267 length:1491 start_codon:yes stop_codon:yes gene_type:complete
MIEKIKYISLDTIDVSSFQLIKERVSHYQNQDHSRWVFKKDNLYYKIWNETYIRKNNIINGILSGFYDKTTCPALYGLIFWEGICRGYIMHECNDYDRLDEEFFKLIKNKTANTKCFTYDFCEQHVKKYKGQYTLIDLEGIYHLDYYKIKSKEQKLLNIPGKFMANDQYKQYVESLIYTPLSEEDFLDMEMHKGRGGKEIILNDYNLKTVRDVVNYFSNKENLNNTIKKLKPENWQYFNCMLAEFRHNVGDHHKIGWENMTEYYYNDLEPMDDSYIEEFLKLNPVPFFNGFVKHGFHRACSMIGRLIAGKSYIPFYMDKNNFFGKSPIDNINYIRDLDNLGIPRNEYTITNSAILSLMNIPERVNKNGDLDIVISPKLRNFLQDTKLKLPSSFHPFGQNDKRFCKYGCSGDDDLIKNYSVSILGFNFAEPRFYFNRMHRVTNTPHRSLDENYKIKEIGRNRVLGFYKNKKYKKYPYNKFSLEGWGFELVKELEIIK